MRITRRRGQWGPIKTNLSDILSALYRFIRHSFLFRLLRRSYHYFFLFLFLFFFFLFLSPLDNHCFIHLSRLNFLGDLHTIFFFLKAEIHFQLSARIQHFATLQINPGYWDGYWNQNALEKHINFLAKIIISISNKYYTPFKNLKFKCYFISHIEEEKLIT